MIRRNGGYFAREAGIAAAGFELGQLAGELRGDVGAVVGVWGDDALRADVAEGRHRSSVQIAQQLPDLAIAVENPRARQADLECAEHDTVELRHQHVVEVEARARVIDGQDARRRDGEPVRHEAEHAGFLAQLPAQRVGIDLEDDGRAIRLQADFEDGGDLAAVDADHTFDLGPGDHPVEQPLCGRDRQIELRLQCHSPLPSCVRAAKTGCPALLLDSFAAYGRNTFAGADRACHPRLDGAAPARE